MDRLGEQRAHAELFPRPAKPVSAEEWYGWDTGGFVVAHGAVKSEDLAAVAAGDVSSLLESDEIHRYLDQLMGKGSRLDSTWHMVAPENSQPPAPPAGSLGPVLGGCSTSGMMVAAALTSVDSQTGSSSAPAHVANDQGFNNGVRVVVALEDTNADNAIVVLPASHKSQIAPPEEVFAGADLGTGPRSPITLAPTLKAGDVLFCASRLLHGVHGTPSAVAAEYIVRTARSSGRLDEESVDDAATTQPWFASLTEAERVVIGLLDTDDERPVLKSDGTEALIQVDNSFHPALMAPTEDEMIDANEAYFWDLNGYLIIRDVMDPEWLAVANEAVDLYQDQATPDAGHTKDTLGRLFASEDYFDRKSMPPHMVGKACTDKAIGSDRLALRDLFNLPSPYNEPFIRMMAHPELARRLNVSVYHLDLQASVCTYGSDNRRCTTVNFLLAG